MHPAEGDYVSWQFHREYHELQSHRKKSLVLQKTAALMQNNPKTYDSPIDS